MAHRYGLPIRVRRDKDGAPRSFLWRGETYHVREVLSTWHLMDRWWISPVSVALGHEPRGHSDRTYYRLLLPDHQVFELYHDAANNLWILDVIQD